MHNANPQNQQESPFLEFFYSIPIVTRILLVATLSFSVSASFYPKIAEISVFDPQSVTDKFQFWRLVTPAFLTRLGFGFIIHLIIIFRFSKEMEEEYFGGSTKDYLFYICFILGLLNIISVFYFPMHSSFINCILYTACRANPNSIVTLLFGLSVRRMYLPWVLLLINVLMGQSLIPELVSILVAHCYYFCRHVIPVNYPKVPLLV